MRREDRMLGDASRAVDAAERVGACLHEPNAAIWVRRHGAWLAVAAWNGKFRYFAVEADAADTIACSFAEPQHAVANRNRERSASWRDTLPKLGDFAVR